MDNRQGEFITAPTTDGIRETLKKMADTRTMEQRYMAELHAALDKGDGVFSVGEEVMIKGSRFRVVSFTRKGRLTLRLLPREEG